MSSISRNEKIPLLQSKKLISIELTSNSFSKEALSIFKKYDFVAVTWIGDFEYPTASDIPPIKLANELISEGLTVLLHIPGRNLSKTMALEVLSCIKNIGVRNILVLRGQSSSFRENDDEKVDFPYADSFVEFIRQQYHDYFAIGVAGYPEMHPQSKNCEEDMLHLKNKVSKGADFIVTQASFDYSSYEKFHQRCQTYGIKVPILIGAVFLSTYKQVSLLTNICKISIVGDDLDFIQKNRENPEAIQEFGWKHLMSIGKNVLRDESPFYGCHIFTLNNLDILGEILMKLKHMNSEPNDIK